jgi:hypothetical protein
LQPPELGRGFDDVLIKSIDETISALLSREVLDAFYVHLQRTYSFSKAEVPRRLEVICSTLEETLGLPSSKTICKAIARKFYAELGLTLFGNPGGTLIEYVDQAKIKLRERGSQV